MPGVAKTAGFSGFRVPIMQAPDPAPGGQPATPPDIATGVANSRQIAWMGGDILYLGNTALDERATNRHWGGIIVMQGYLPPSGNGGNWTGDASATFNVNDGRLTGFDWQKQIKDSAFVSRCSSRGMNLYIGIYSANLSNPATHFVDPFDDTAWNTYCTQTPTDGQGLYSIIRAASWMGFKGVHWDMESYAVPGGQEAGHASVELAYPGNTHNEAQTRAAWFTRGAQVMTCVLAAWAAGGAAQPIEISFYVGDTLFHSYGGLIQRIINGFVDAGKSAFFDDFWHGMCSVSGYGKITYADHALYKTTHISNMPWDNAVQYGANALSSYWSQYFTPENWAKAAGKIGSSALLWIDKGGNPFEATMAEATMQLAAPAANKYSVNGRTFMYGHHHHEDSWVDGTTRLWSSYYDELATLTSTTSPNGSAPTITVTSLNDNEDGTVHLVASLNHAWGIAALKWELRSGPTGAVIAESGALPHPFSKYDVSDTNVGAYASVARAIDVNFATGGGVGDWFVFTVETFIGQARSVVVQCAL